MKLHVVLILLPTVALLPQKPENVDAEAVHGAAEVGGTRTLRPHRVAPRPFSRVGTGQY